MTPLVSIIMPVYNTEAYLDRCLESIVSQTYKNIEIICVNDGSTDDSGSILEKWKAKDSRIRVFHKENGGVSSARNKGLDECRGDYICFADPDDTIKPDMYEKLLSAIQREKSQISMCGYRMIDSNGRVEERFFGKDNVSSEEWFTDVFKKNHLGVLWNKLFRRDVIFTSTHNYRFDEAVHLWEDILFLTYVCRERRIAICDELLYNYYVYDASLSHCDITPRRATVVLTYNRIFSNCLKYYPASVSSANCFIVVGALHNYLYSKELDERIKKELINTFKRQYKYSSRKLKSRIFLTLYMTRLYRLLLEIRKI